MTILGRNADLENFKTAFQLQQHCGLQGDDLSLLLSPGETHPECWGQFWAPQDTKDRDVLGGVQ